MHILHVITGLGGGGAEGALYRLVVNDSENKHTVVSLLGEGIYTDRLKKQGIPVLTLNISFNIFLYRAIARLITVCEN